MTIVFAAAPTSKASDVTEGICHLGRDLRRPRLVPNMAIVFGSDKFRIECRSLTNIIGNGVATVFGGRASLNHDQ